MNDTKKSNQKFLKWNKFSVVTLITAITVSSFTISETSSLFTETTDITVKSQADVLKPPASLVVKNVRVGETDLSWTASASTYVTGYKIYRSEKISGPWTLLGSNTGRTKVTYTDTNSGAKSWYYKVEAVYKTWSAAGFPFEAPPAVGRSFFDGFEGAASDLNGRKTEDGKSVWLVWSGEMDTHDSGTAGGYAAYGTPGLGPSPDSGDVAVVRTPSKDGQVYAADFDGYERVVLRAKDPGNYIYVGGAGPKGSFEIAKVENGNKTILASDEPGLDRNFRVTIKGNSIKAYIDATQNDPQSGILYATATIDFLLNDPSATYFGIGFTRGGYGIDSFTFEAI